MDLYNLGSTFLDISIGILVIGVIVRFIMALSYFKRNGSRTLTEVQKKNLKKAVIPIAIVGLLFGVASIVLLLNC